MRTMKCILVLVLLCAGEVSVAGEQDKQTSNTTSFWIKSNDVLVLVPSSRKKLISYSITRDSWSEIDVSGADPKLTQSIVPLVAGSMVACQIGRTVFAFSSKSNEWGKLTLPEGSTAVPVLDDKTISIEEKDAYYVFGINSSVWSGVDRSTGRLLDLKP